jgi:hypothetical protein
MKFPGRIGQISVHANPASAAGQAFSGGNFSFLITLGSTLLPPIYDIDPTVFEALQSRMSEHGNAKY